MTPDQKKAIGRLVVVQLDGTRLIGTAFVVADRYLLTAFHVVGDRPASAAAGKLVTYNSSLTFEVGGDHLKSVPVNITQNAYDPIDDWALLEADAPIAGINPLPLGEISQREMDEQVGYGKLEFESWGFPIVGQLSGSGVAISGRIQDGNSRYQGGQAFQLFSENAAAALGDPLSGLSGAPCLMDGAAVGIIRSNLVTSNNGAHSDPKHIVGGILYACPITTPTLQDRCAAYLPSLDPIRGLPGLPVQPLPSEPFRYLRWYGPEHAEAFFGRSGKIRDLYNKVVNTESPRLLLVYGASGVGKSSLLQAGLLPRLGWHYDVRTGRRQPGTTLLQNFEGLLAGSSTSTGVNPIIILLDQVEEVFVDQNADGNAELSALAKRIAKIINSEVDPAKIVLSFRSEWLANVRARLVESFLPFGEFYLERFAHAEVEEIVRGVASTDRMRQFYRVDIDKGLPGRIADDLLTDPTSPVSPILSIILTRLWAEAKAQRSDKQRLSLAVYEQRMRNKLDLDQFLSEQVKAVSVTKSPDVSSGLVTDILYRHTTNHGTAKEVTWSELQKMYAQLSSGKQSEYLSSLISTLCSNSLLYTVGEEFGARELTTRLAHDTLAAPVRRSYESSELPGQRAERRLVSWLEDWEVDKFDSPTLDSKALALVRQGARGMRDYTPTEREFIEASERACEKAAWRAFGYQALTGLLAITVVGGLVIWVKGPSWLKERAYWFEHVSALSAGSERTLTDGEALPSECTDCPIMVVVKPGEMQMGSPASQQRVNENEKPQHLVKIDKWFAVSEHEVTFGEWNACVTHGDCPSEVNSLNVGEKDLPVVNVSWDDAGVYVAWLSTVTGRTYRLLSEAEWEYAARAGSSAYFSFGDDDLQLPNYAWYEANSATDDDLEHHPHPVGQKNANKFGLYDMNGNVAEWVEDCFHNSYHGPLPRNGSAWTSESCLQHVVRGGSFQDRARQLRSAARDAHPNTRAPYIGFRVARELNYLNLPR
jgi:formylglycine-generating enzyme required for sulfatase activity